MWKDFESQNFFKIDSWHIKIEKLKKEGGLKGVMV